MIVIVLIAVIVITVVVVAVVVTVVIVAIRTCNAYFIFVTSEGQDLFIDLNEFPNCRHSGNEVMLETLGGESNNGRVIIADLALCRQQLLHEIRMRVKNVQLGTSNQD